jgi:hypothetical protein
VVEFRKYDSSKDKDAAVRTWREVGWVEDGEKQTELVAQFLDVGRTLVAEVNGEAESLAASAPGTVRYLDERLPFAAVTAVTTSRVARKQGLAKRLTARLIAADALDGALVSGLGIFEQGFYNLLGYGSGGYEHWLHFDPAQLRIDYRHRVPRRVTVEDAEAVHASRLARKKGHGAVNLLPVELTEVEMKLAKEGFGLGYFDGPKGELTHHLWFNGSGEQGPYSVWWYSYQTGEQLLELLSLMQSLGDQVRLLRMREPRDVQLQDFLEQPFRFRQLTQKAKYENRMKATAYWQVRMCDLQGCLERTHLATGPLRFNLRLSDPVERYLPEDAGWRGTSGEYVVTLGPESGAESGRDASLPTLHSSVNAFTRLWLGALPATGLAISADLRGPEGFLRELDELLRLPTPKLDWDF